jgi:hypothetical protein
MELAELQRRLVEVLEAADIPYFVTGSAATIYYGEPRFTNDLDIVAEIRESHIPNLLAAFPSPEFYLSPDALRDAIRRRSMVNILHPGFGLKVDLIVPASTPFNTSRFQRKVRVHPSEGQQAWYSAPEDIILKKMDFYREGGSDKHLRDITGMFKVMGDQIDTTYIAEWAARLDLEEIWALVLARTGGMSK